jgi:hypothetical protein
LGDWQFGTHHTASELKMIIIHPVPRMPMHQRALAIHKSFPACEIPVELFQLAVHAAAVPFARQSPPHLD